MEQRFSTERLEVEPWNDTLSSSELEELAGILDEDVTAFLPPSLQCCSIVTAKLTFSSGPKSFPKEKYQVCG